MQKIISREIASALGLDRYFTGKPCRTGHLAERKVLNGRCIVCVQAQRHRHYYKDHKRTKLLARARREKNIEIRRKYYCEHREELRAKHRRWYKNNHDYALQWAREYREKNREEVTAKQRERNRANAHERRAMKELGLI